MHGIRRVLLDRAGIPPTAGAEELTVAQFCALARAVEEIDR
jgi:hypothetical protein